jgi:hypothetical protein
MKKGSKCKKRDETKKAGGETGPPIPGIGDEVGLELGEVHIEGPIKPQGGRDGRHNLACTKVMC